MLFTSDGKRSGKALKRQIADSFAIADTVVNLHCCWSLAG